MQGERGAATDYVALGNQACEHVELLLQIAESDSESTDSEFAGAVNSADHLPQFNANIDFGQDNPDSDRIAPDRLLQKIGEGGMGQVYMAQQLEPVRRKVALKLIRSDSSSRDTLARFDAERQALVMMGHQNIARVLDAWVTQKGLTFFAMELVKGIPITRYCDECKLSIEDRLSLFRQVWLGVYHAHQRGVILA